VIGSRMTTSDLLYFIDRGKGPPLLLVHGLMITGEMFEAGHQAVIEYLMSIGAPESERWPTG
jgi:hypothetical protein